MRTRTLCVLAGAVALSGAAATSTLSAASPPRTATDVAPAIISASLSSRTIMPGGRLRARVSAAAPGRLTVMLLHGRDTKAAAQCGRALVEGTGGCTLRIPRVLAPGPWRVRITVRDGERMSPAWTIALRVAR